MIYPLRKIIFAEAGGREKYYLPSIINLLFDNSPRES